MTDKYKVVFVPALGSEAQFEEEFATYEEAKTCLSVIANYTLMLHDCGLMVDHANCGMVLYFDGEDWIEAEGDD